MLGCLGTLRAVLAGMKHRPWTPRGEGVCLTLRHLLSYIPALLESLYKLSVPF